MSAFIKGKFKTATADEAKSINIYDRVTMIDEAYRNDDRHACAKMIEDLYAVFDKADQAL